MTTVPTEDFLAARRLLGQRLRNRAQYWRNLANDHRGQQRRSLLARSLEALDCAEVAEELSPDHVPPPEPDMEAARAVRKRKEAPDAPA